MRNARSSWLVKLVGFGFAAAGLSKLVAVAPQERLFSSWGWTRQDMQIMGAAELLGAAMLVTTSTQRLGATLLSASSVCVLSAEMRHHNDRLITPRLGMLGAAVLGFWR